MVGVIEHSHVANVAKVQAAKVKESLKQQATVNRATPGQLIIDSRSLMLVFCADTALHLFSRSSTWMMGGTFDTAPNIFSQLYVIRAPLGESSVSCVYALLNDKSQSTYEKLIIAIQ